MEAEKGLPVSFLCDRHTTKVCVWLYLFETYGTSQFETKIKQISHVSSAPLYACETPSTMQVNKSQVGFIQFMITPFFSSFCSFLKSKGNNASVCEREMSACTWRKRMIDKQCNRFGVTEFLDEVRWMILDLFEMIYNNYFSSGRFAPKYEQQQKRMAAISEHRG